MQWCPSLIAYMSKSCSHLSHPTVLAQGLVHLFDSVVHLSLVYIPEGLNFLSPMKTATQ